MPVVSSLFIYPIKSCRGIAVSTLHFEARGPAFDRRWMLVTPQGDAITQRQNPRLALIETQLSGGLLKVRAPKQQPLSIEPAPLSARRAVRVWSFEGEALDAGTTAAEWFSQAIGEECRLVQFAPDVHRRVSQQFTDLKSELAFADGYPALLTSLESLSELNRRLATPLPMNRFRPNIVVRDCRPFEEDSWQTLEGADLRLSVVKPCDRCKITTIDQAQLKTSKEPLRTLATFRKTPEGVLFGQNCVHHAPGSLRVGEVLRATYRSGAAT